MGNAPGRGPARGTARVCACVRGQRTWLVEEFNIASERTPRGTRRLPAHPLPQARRVAPFLAHTRASPGPDAPSRGPLLPGRNWPFSPVAPSPRLPWALPSRDSPPRSVPPDATVAGDSTTGRPTDRCPRLRCSPREPWAWGHGGGVNRFEAREKVGETRGSQLLKKWGEAGAGREAVGALERRAAPGPWRSRLYTGTPQPPAAPLRAAAGPRPPGTPAPRPRARGARRGGGGGRQRRRRARNVRRRPRRFAVPAPLQQQQRRPPPTVAAVEPEPLSPAEVGL